MSFCSAGLLLLLFPLHNKTEHSWGWDMGWGVGGGGASSSLEAGRPAGQGFLLKEGGGIAGLS